MKILAIRGENLASLDGRFALELERPPLVGAGVFAIAGRTGAGKSTILDAMCLALFNETPRSADGEGTVVGREDEKPELRLRASDVKSLLRKGRAHGSAEVDFLARDGRRYRARWEVWRARQRVDGKVQDPVCSLLDLESGERTMERTNTEVLKKIGELLGLDFHQFRRSVLLAQGDFAAFLRAKEGDRAQLLERMTGTAVYAELSRQAHEKWKAASQQIRSKAELLSQAEALVLKAPEREALDEGIAWLEQEARALRQTKEQLQAALAWHEALGRLQHEEATARAALAGAERAWAENEPRRQEVAGVAAARPLQGALQGVEQAQTRLRKAGEQLALAEEGIRLAEQERAEREEARQAAARRQHEAAAALEQAQPEIARARELDRQIAAGDADEKEKAGLAAAAGAALAQEQTRLRALRAQEAELSAARERAEAWLAARAELSPVAGEWGRWREQLQRLAEAQRRGKALDAAQSEATRRREQARLELQEYRHATTAAGTKVQTANEELRQFEEAIQAIDEGALQAQRKQLQARAGLLGQLQVQQQQAEAQAAEAQAQGERARAAGEAADRARAEAAAALQQEQQLAAALGEARWSLDQIRATRSLEQQRGELRPGKPCPLCGSTAHPWADRSPPAEAWFRKQQERVDELEVQRGAAVKRASAAGGRAEEEQRRQGEAEQGGARAAGLLGQARQRWQQLLDDAGEAAAAEDPARPAASGWLEDARTALEKRQGTLDGGIDRLESLRKREAQARRDQKLALRQAEEAEQAQRSKEAALGQVESQLREQALEQQHLRASAGEAQASLTQAFPHRPDWQGAAADDAAGLLQRLEQEVAAWQEQRTRQEEAGQQRSRLAPELADSARSCDAQQKTAGERAAELQHLREQLEELRRERATLLAGEPTETVEQCLQAEARLASTVQEEARQALEQVEQQLAGLGGSLQTWRHQHGEDEAAAKQARQALDDALAAAGLQEDELRRRLSRDEAWLAARRQESAALQAALATARTLAVERRRRREEHEAAAGHPSLAAEEAQAALQAAEERAAPQQQELERHKGLRTRDELERERRAALLAELGELERASAVWKTLDELIGSSDGKKLRVFAQGLTLDLLLQHANAHMREVAPRYSLMRAPDHDMALQVVDHDMGNEVRGISSLSGGESFLASLALALGLASLSSRRTPIKSLFIDEGFGSLDPHSLEQALAALESLHATGRQVGIISHLPAIAERLGVQVRVLAQGSGKSRVEVVG